MAESRDCPVCGSPIMFKYVRPDFDFYISKDGTIKRDTNNDLWEGKDPYLIFHCTSDMLHDLYSCPSNTECLDFQNKWEESINKEFYDKIFPDL